MARMTKTTKANLQAADRVEIDNSSSTGVYQVRILKGGKLAYLSDSQGPICYKSISAARRVVKRVRPDLEPTTI